MSPLGDTHMALPSADWSFSHPAVYSRDQFFIEEDSLRAFLALNLKQATEALAAYFSLEKTSLQNKRDISDNLHFWRSHEKLLMENSPKSRATSKAIATR